MKDEEIKSQMEKTTQINGSIISKIIKTIVVLGMFIFFLTHRSFYVAEHNDYYKKRIALVILMTFSSLFLIWTKKILNEKNKKTAAILLFISTPFVSFFALEYANIIKSRFLWHVVLDLGKKKCLLSVIILFEILLVFLVITNSYRWSAFLVSLIVCIFGTANYFVYTLRGIPILASDLSIAGTALNVAGQYEYHINYPVFILIFITIFWGIVLMKTGKIKAMKNRVRIGTALVSCLICCISIKALIFSNDFGVSLNTCNPHKSYKQSGSVLTFIKSIQLMQVEKPDSYSYGLAEKIAEEYPEDTENSATPNVIIMMDEAFSDLQSVGDFKTNKDVIPFYHSMKDNCIKGNMYVSSFGGKTANTEFEVLTGDSIGFFPPSATPYQIFVKHELPNLTTDLKKQGYRNTIGMHPFKSTSYNRKMVYELFGFDTRLYIDDFNGADTIRGFVSDHADVKRIIQEYETAKEKSDAPFFIHNVTMQNHSPYKNDPAKLGDVIKPEKGYDYNDVEVYLTLIHKSDQALEELVTYFENLDDPTVILFFGDHQPGLNEEFYTKLLGKPIDKMSDEELMQKYYTPYVIWANFDIEEKEMDISSNFLVPLMKQATGMKLTGYNQFLLRLQNELPIVTLNGYWDNNGKFYKLDDETSPYYDLIYQYSVLQYNHMFDSHNRLENFFN